MTISKEDLSCPCCGKSIVSPVLLEKLNELERATGEHLHIVSGYKCTIQAQKTGLDTSPATRGSTCVISYSSTKELWEILEKVFQISFRQIKVGPHTITLGVDPVLGKYFSLDR